MLSWVVNASFMEYQNSKSQAIMVFHQHSVGQIYKICETLDGGEQIFGIPQPEACKPIA
jgi:hypothetical protein